MNISLYALIFTATLAVLANARNTQYCNLPSCEGQPHTACLYSAKKTAAACGKVFSYGVTEAQKREILDTHNSFRAKVASGNEKRGNPGPQPGSRNLGPLRWSNELADVAQAWANQCNYDHDKCRNTPKEWIGQNIAAYPVYAGPPHKSLSTLIQLWYDEVQYFDRRMVSSFAFGKKYGHYSQMVWAKTTHVGCGVIIYSNEKDVNTTYLVCNYGPSGNYRGKPVY